MNSNCIKSCCDTASGRGSAAEPIHFWTELLILTLNHNNVLAVLYSTPSHHSVWLTPPPPRQSVPGHQPRAVNQPCLLLKQAHASAFTHNARFRNGSSCWRRQPGSELGASKDWLDVPCLTGGVPPPPPVSEDGTSKRGSPLAS